MIVDDLAVLADELRREGFSARNLCQAGITIWQDRDGYFLSLDELKQLPPYVTARDFHQILARKRSERHV